jgi:hypothetical protein
LRLRRGATLGCAVQRLRRRVRSVGMVWLREAVISRSPGSRERTLGHGAIASGHTPKALYNGKMIGPTIRPIRRRRLTIARVSSHFTAVSSRNRRLCHFSNPFGVCPSCGVPDPGCALRLRRGATLGCAVQRLRRRERSVGMVLLPRSGYIPEPRVARAHPGSRCHSPRAYAEGVVQRKNDRTNDLPYTPKAFDNRTGVVPFYGRVVAEPSFVSLLKPLRGMPVLCGP